MMAVTTRCTIHAISEVNQFMGYRYLDRLWLHVWLDKDEMAMAGQMELQSLLKGRKRRRQCRFTSACRSTSGCARTPLMETGRRAWKALTLGKVAVTAQHHGLKSFPCPAH